MDGVRAVIEHRLSDVRKAISALGADCMLVSSPENCLYLSSFTGEGRLLVCSRGQMLMTDSRYVEQAAAEAPEFQVVTVTGEYAEAVNSLVADLSITCLCFEESHLTFKEYADLRKALGTVELKPVSNVVESLRMRKTSEEVNSIRKAAHLTDMAFEHILEMVRPGVTELEIAIEMEFFMRRNGASASAFPIIIASGARGSLPHGTASSKPLRFGEMITIDAGAVVDHYCSDMTRTISLGEPPLEIRKVYDVVLEAQQAAVASVRPGMRLRDIDAVARDIMARAGYGSYFGHGLGHGVGLAVHEPPRLSPKAPPDGLVENGMVFTVEPGVYIPGLGGVRIEDTVWVHDDMVEILTMTPKRLIVL